MGSEGTGENANAKGNNQEINQDNVAIMQSSGLYCHEGYLLQREWNAKHRQRERSMNARDNESGWYWQREESQNWELGREESSGPTPR